MWTMPLTLFRPTISRVHARFVWPDRRGLEWAAPVAAAGPALAVLAAAPGSVWLAGIAVAALMLWIVWQDLASFTISDAAILALATIAFALRWAQGAGDAAWPRLAPAVVDVGLCGGIMLAFREIHYRRKGVDGLGLGDVKLAAVGALLVGGLGFSWALFAASLGGLAAVAVSHLIRPAQVRLEKLAFGALLAPALGAVWFIEQALPRLGWG